ncbi:MAG: glycosyltransferase [archaeon]
MAKKLSIVIPAYNEEKNIVPTVKSYYNFFSENLPDFEIIVVVNNSSDKTFDLASKFSAGRPEIAVLNFDFYTGKGGAVIEGFRACKGNLAGFADADDSTVPSEFFRLVKCCDEGFDVVIGSRSVNDSVIRKKQPLYRRILGSGFRFITNLLFGLGINDTQCGAKVFSRKTLELLLREKISKGFEFDVQMLWIAKRNGLRIKEKGIRWSDNADSKVGFFEPLKMLIGLLRLRFGG